MDFEEVVWLLAEAHNNKIYPATIGLGVQDVARLAYEHKERGAKLAHYEANAAAVFSERQATPSEKALELASAIRVTLWGTNQSNEVIALAIDRLIDQQIAASDLAVVWKRIQLWGGSLDKTHVTFMPPVGIEPIRFHRKTHGGDWLHQAAQWVRETDATLNQPKNVQ